MVDTNWGLVADERINKKIDFQTIKTKEDYIKEIQSILQNTPDPHGNYPGRNILKAKKRDPDSILEEMYEESTAKEKIEEKQKENLKALRKALKLELRRKPRSRHIDERTTAKDTRKATPKTVRYWRKRMGRLDIRGVDTRIIKRNMITKADLQLKNYIVDIDKRGIKHYRDLKGRFTQNPFKKRKK